jgi:hypothetical protein
MDAAGWAELIARLRSDEDGLDHAGARHPTSGRLGRVMEEGKDDRAGHGGDRKSKVFWQ